MCSRQYCHPYEGIAVVDENVVDAIERGSAQQIHIVGRQNLVARLKFGHGSGAVFGYAGNIDVIVS